MRHIWLKGAMIGAAVILGSNGIRAEEEIVGGALQLMVMNGDPSAWRPYINERGYGTSNDSSGFYFDVGAERLLTGVMFHPRTDLPSTLWSRFAYFRLWGTNNREDAANKNWKNMTLVASNYVGMAAIAGYNTLIPEEGTEAYRYYYLTDYMGSFHGFELWSASPSVRVYAPIVDNLDEGNYTYTGKVSYVEGDAGEICVAIADKDYDDDFDAWEAKGQIVKASKTFAAGDAFSIEVKGVARGRRYSRVFVRANSEGAWYPSCRTWYFSARPEMMTLEAYAVDTADTTTTNSEGKVTGYNSAYCFYDGKTDGHVESCTVVSAIIFKLDPTKDYSSIRVYPRCVGVNLTTAGGGYTCFARISDLYPFSVTADDLTFTDAVQSTFVAEPRKLYFVKPTGVSEANWTAIDSIKTALRNHSDSSGTYIELPIPKGAFAGKKWLKIDVNSRYRSNCREIELLTVRTSGLVIRVQ